MPRSVGLLVLLSICCSVHPDNGLDVAVQDIATDIVSDVGAADKGTAPPKDPHPSGQDTAGAGDASDSVELLGTPTELSLTSLTPDYGPTEGLTTVTLVGTGFSDGIEVFFGDSKALYVFVLDTTHANCSTPPHGPGVVDVRVRRPDGAEAILKKAFRFEAKLGLESVEPSFGPASGGTPLLIRGSGFSNDTVLLLGGRAVIAQRVVDDRTVLAIAPSGTPGPASLIAVSGPIRVRLPRAFTYTEAPELSPVPNLKLSGISPAFGPPEGGTPIILTGSGFTPDVTVRIGPLPATSVKVLDQKTIEAVTPPGSPGPADVTVETLAGGARIKGGFTYDPGKTRVLAVEPDSGSWAGGAWVRIYGWGLDDVKVVMFGSEEALEKEVISSVLAVARTPRSEVLGLVPVLVFGEETAMGDAAFAYFDPRLSGGGTWGGPIDGALNVTVLNGSTGKAVPSAFVIVGEDPHTPLQGMTDDRGQVTLSLRDGLRGPVRVHGTRDGFSAYSVVDFDAANVTFYISPAPSPENPANPPPDTYGNCTVRGRILDYGKYFLKPPGVEGNFTVRCFASAPSMFGAPAENNPKATPDKYGRFEVTGRTGEFAVVCALSVTSPNDYRPRTLRIGVARHISCAKAGDVVEGVELSLAMEADGELWVNAGPMPVWLGGVSGPYVTGGYELGSDGYLPLIQYPLQEGTRLLFRGQPREFVGPFGGYGYSFYGSISAKDSGMPYGVVMAQRVQPLGQSAMLVEGEAGFSLVPISSRFAVTAMRAAGEDRLLVADRSGRTYWTEGTDLYLGQVSAPGPILGLWGQSNDDFWASSTSGVVYHVVGVDVLPETTGVFSDLTGISGGVEADGTIVVVVAGGPFLIRRDSVGWQFEHVPGGVDLRAVRWFDGGTVVAVGKEGAIVKGQSGQEKSLLRPVATDLEAVEGPSPSDFFAVGAAGTVLHVVGEDVYAYTTPGGQNLHGLVVRGPCDVLVFGDEGAIFEFDCSNFKDRSRPDAGVDILAGALLKGIAMLAGRPTVNLPHFMPFPEIKTPAEEGLWSGDRLAWEYVGDAVVSYQQVILSNAEGRPFWMMTTSGQVREVPLPDFGSMIGYSPVPKGTKRMNLTGSRAPGFDINRYSSKDLGYYNREAFTVGLVTFDNQ